MKKITYLFFIVLMIFITSSGTVAAEQYADKAVDKLGNGLANAVTGVAEIPKTMSIVAHKDGVLHAMTIGLFTGLVNTVGRTLSGAFDIATFLIPTTPFVKPAFIWDDFDRETTFVEGRMR